MKILPVSISFKSQKSHNDNFDSSYFYTAQESVKKDYLPQYSLATGLIALLAVVITLFNVGSKK